MFKITLLSESLACCYLFYAHTAYKTHFLYTTMFGNGEISTTASQKCLNHPIMLQSPHHCLYMQIFKCFFPHQENCCVVKQLSATSSSPHPQPSTVTHQKHNNIFFLFNQGVEENLDVTCNWCIRSRLFFSPCRYKHSDIFMSFFQKPINS